MAPLTWLVFVTTAINGILAGTSFDTALVKLPARKRIGPVLYAQFAAANDLGNGLVVYPALGILSALSVFAAMLAAFFGHKTPDTAAPLYAAGIMTIVHSLCTAKAAPIMLGIKNKPDDEATLERKLDKFALWHALRALFQAGAFVAMLWALVMCVKAD